MLTHIETVNVENITVQLNTTSPVNMSVSIDGASEISLANNTNNTVASLGPFTEGQHNFSWISRDATGNNSNNETSIFDFTLPVIEQLANISGDSYEVNFSNIFNVTDAISGLASCLINITDLENVTPSDNFLINCTDTQTFITAGLHNLVLTTTDNAGNINTTTFNFSISPFIFVTYFNNVTAAQLFDFTVKIFHPDGRITSQSDVNGTIFLTPVNNNTLDLGNHTLEFTKSGFLITNNTVLVNATNAGINTSFNITPVTLSMMMFNSSNPSQQLTFNVTILNSTSSIVFLDQTNFSKLFTEIPTGDITMIVSSNGFASATFFNTITEFTSIIVIGFLIPSTTSSVIQFTTLEFGSSDPIENVIIEAQQLINGSFVTVSQANTDATGQTFMNLDPTISYLFIFTKEGFITATINAIPGTLSYTIRLRLSIEEFGFADGVGYQFTPVGNLLFVPDNFNFTGLISGTSISLSTYTLTDQNGTILFTDNSTNPTGTTFTTVLELLNTTNITTITATITYIKDSTTTTVSKSYDITTLTNTSFVGIAQAYALNTDEESQLNRWFIMIVAIAGGLLAGRLVNLNATGAGLLMVPITGFFLFIGWMPINYFAVLSAASLFFFVGGSAFTR